MKNKKISILLLFILLGMLLFSACTKNNSYDVDVKEKYSTTIAETKEEPTSEKLDDPEYAQVRFGDTKDILLLDVEWHTYESYKEMLETLIADGEEIPELVYEHLEKIKNKEMYISKRINGKNSSSLTSSNPYKESKIDPDGYFIYNIYPFRWSLYYIDDNYYKDFFGDGDITIYSEKEFYFILDDVISYYDELLAENKITQEMYDYVVLKSPLDYFVKVLKWFDESAAPDNPLPDILPVSDIIRGKEDFSILFVGNSFVYTGNVPQQLSVISSMYGINVNCDSIAPGGAKLGDTMNQAIEKMQNNNYDYVILQDYGGRQRSERVFFMSEVETLCEEARKSGAIPVLYNPAWANIEGKPDGDTQVSLNVPYERASKVNGAILVNVADAWIYAYDNHPDLSLYAKNDYHANNAGAYLTACVFASTLFDLHIKDVAEDNIYHSDDSIILGQAAWEYASYYNENKKSPTDVVTVSDGLNEQVIK